MRKVLGVLGLWLGLSVPGFATDVDDLIKQLKDTDTETRRAAARSLADAGAEAKPAERALLGALRDRDMFVRRFAAKALGAIGADPKDTVPALRAALNDTRKEVQEAAATALGKMGKDGVNSLAAVVRDEGREPEVRRKAAEALGALGANARPAVKSLVEVLKAPPGGNNKRANPTDIRVEVVVALGQIASAEDKDTVAAISVLAENKNRNRSLQAAARDALKGIQNNM